MAHEGRRVLGAHDDVLHVAGRDDELAAGVGELLGGQAHRLEDAQGVLEQGPLGHGDAQRAGGHAHARRHHAGVAGLAQNLLEALQREGKAAGGKAGAAEVCQDGVVAAAGGQAPGDALRVGLEDDAGVVVEGIDDGEVKARAAVVKEVTELGHERAELLAAALCHGHVGFGQQSVDLVDDLEAAVHARDGVQGANGGGLERGGGVHELVEGDEVGVVHQGKDPLAEVGRGGAVGQQGRQGRDRAKDHAPGGNAQLGQDLGEKVHDLDLRRRAPSAPTSSTPSWVNWRGWPRSEGSSRTTGAA